MREIIGQDVLGKIRLALIEIAGHQLDRQQAAPFELKQDGKQAVGIPCAGQADSQRF